MAKSESSIFYMSLINRLEKLKYWILGAVGVANNIWNAINLPMIYKNLHAKFGVDSFKTNWDLCAHTDRQTRSRRIYTLWSFPGLLLHVTYIFTKLVCLFFDNFQWSKAMNMQQTLILLELWNNMFGYYVIWYDLYYKEFLCRDIMFSGSWKHHRTRLITNAWMQILPGSFAM